MVRVILFCAVFLIYNCSNNKALSDTQEVNQDRKIASVYEREILYSDIKDLISQDSAYFTNEYINKAAKEEGILRKLKESALSMDEIENRTNQFRKSLMIAEFQKEFWKGNKDTLVADSTIKHYFDRNSQSFHLQEDIFKGFFIKIPVNTPKIEKLKELMKSKSVSDIRELKSYCLRYANSFVINTDSWLAFPKEAYLIKEINQGNTQTSQVLTQEKEDHLYLVRLIDFKRSRQPSPYEYCREEIKMLILNKRKMKAWEMFNEQVLNEAKSSHNIEIYP